MNGGDANLTYYKVEGGWGWKTWDGLNPKWRALLIWTSHVYPWLLAYKGKWNQAPTPPSPQKQTHSLIPSAWLHPQAFSTPPIWFLYAKQESIKAQKKTSKALMKQVPPHKKEPSHLFFPTFSWKAKKQNASYAFSPFCFLTSNTQKDNKF